MTTSTSIRESEVGPMLRGWRRTRRWSQLGLSSEVGISARHLSFLETGRSSPSRSMLLRLAEFLEIPQREQNRLLIAAGFAPAYTERALSDPELATVGAGIGRVLDAYDPYPCLAVDRQWNIVRANAGVGLLLEHVAPNLLERPNALRLGLHPDGLAPLIRNLAEWRHHVLLRLEREAAAAPSPALLELIDELSGYPGGRATSHETDGVAVRLELALGSHHLDFISTVTTFGTALDLTLAELSIEAFLPADADTAAFLAAHRG